MTMFELAWFLTPMVPALPHTAQAWTLVADEDGVRVWTRATPTSDVHEVRAEAIFPLPVETIWRVLRDVGRFVEFMPYLVEARVIGPSGPQSHYEYQRVEPPVVDPRDYTLNVTLVADPITGTFRRSWRLANDHGPPPQPDAVRVKACRGHWVLQRLTPQTTRVKYQVSTTPGGMIPDWLANRVNQDSVPNLLQSVRQRAQDPRWKKD